MYVCGITQDNGESTCVCSLSEMTRVIADSCLYEHAAVKNKCSSTRKRLLIDLLCLVLFIFIFVHKRVILKNNKEKQHIPSFELILQQ